MEHDVTRSSNGVWWRDKITKLLWLPLTPGKLGSSGWSTKYVRRTEGGAEDTLTAVSLRPWCLPPENHHGEADLQNRWKLAEHLLYFDRFV